MIIFKIYTLENVRNSQTTSKKNFKGVFSTLFRVYTQENFSNKPKSFKEFFRRCIHDCFSKYTPRKRFETTKRLQRIFSNVYLRLYSESALKNFFKEFFKNAFKMILQKHLHSGKVSNNIKEKFQFFSIKESLKIASKTVSSWRTSIKKFINQGNQKSFDILALTVNNK